MDSTGTEITVQGRLPVGLVAGLTAVTPEQTVLVTPWTDEDGLYDLLCLLRDLGLEVTEVRRIADKPGTTLAAQR